MGVDLQVGKIGHLLNYTTLGLKPGTTDDPVAVNADDGKLFVQGHYWNPSSSAYEIITGSGGGTRTAAPSTTTRSSVTASSDDTLIISSGTRYGVAIYNDADKDLYLGLGTSVASTTSYTVKMAPSGFYETQVGYMGQIRGKWAPAPTGAARVTELL